MAQILRPKTLEWTSPWTVALSSQETPEKNALLSLASIAFYVKRKYSAFETVIKNSITRLYLTFLKAYR